MVFQRGFADDAIGFFRQALELDPELAEAWFRIGIVEHSRGDFDKAEQAYRKCLKKRPGHAWCNFYYGLLEEQLGNSTKALEMYENAFRKAPALADPDLNPEIRSSRLALAARLRTYDQERFEHNLPMRYMRPNKVRQVRMRYEPSLEPTPAPRAAPETTADEPPEPQPTSAASAPPPRPAPPARRVPTRPPTTQPQHGGTPPVAGGEAPYGSPAGTVQNVSGEARLVPRWNVLWRISEALV
jgi:tetratricopeptide (TPR) repeat protein